jgi:hypothetical protein
MQSGKLPLAVIYAAASLFGCIGGVWLGREIF